MDSSDTDEEVNNNFKWNLPKRASGEDLDEINNLPNSEVVVTDQLQQVHEKKKTKLDTPDNRKPPSSTSRSRQGKESIEYNDEGNPILPVKLGVITLHNLGVVNFTNPQYHNSRHIFPVGFKTSRSFMSTVSPDENTNYTSTIVEGEKGPVFQVVAEDKPDYIYKAASMTGVWTAVSKDALKLRKGDISHAGGRPDHFGLQNPIIKKLILKLPNVDKCVNFQADNSKKMKKDQDNRSSEIISPS